MTVPVGEAAPSAALVLLVVAAGLLASSGVPGLFLSWRSPWGSRLATLLTVAGSAVGLAGGILALGTPEGAGFGLPSAMPGSRLALGADALSGFFSLPVFLVGGLGAIYGSAYWTPRRHPRNGRRLRLSYGLLLSSLTLVLIARDGISFLIAWEIMALTNFFAVTTEDDDAEVRRAGWIYLLYSHLSVLGLFALFVLERRLAGSFSLAAIPAMPAGLATAVFVLALVGFGIKAGAMPLHSWLPSAHASAPSHVSALMSGVVIKMGIYGLVRTCGLSSEPPLLWGVSLLGLGCLAAFFGVVFALAQHDLKRLLAYHTIENIGIILLGLGLAMVGRSMGRGDWVALGMAGCLLHVWNHALFKSLLFFGAGSVIHATGVRDIELTGGLARRMPATAGLFLVGSIAICGLPPLNGFVSEMFVFLGLVRAAVPPGAVWVALPAPVLAATGALAVACFVKVHGIVFLGTARSRAGDRAHESPAPMVAPMVVLAAACFAVGLAPGLLSPALERATAAWTQAPPSSPPLAQLAPLGWISAAAVALLAVVGVVSLAVGPACRRGRRRRPALPTWDCGYAASSPRLQYTASSFAEIVTSRFAWVLRPRTYAPRIERLFPAPESFHAHVDDSVLERVLVPAARRGLRAGAWFRSLPQGQLQRYIAYILAVLVPLLVWAVAAGHPGR